MAEGKSGLSVLLDEKRVNDLLEQRSGLKAFLRQGCNVILFMCFLLCYTLLAIWEPWSDMRSFEGYVRRHFDTEAAMPLREVESVDTFWQYTYDSVLPALFGPDSAVGVGDCPALSETSQAASQSAHRRRRSAAGASQCGSDVRRRRPVEGMHRRRRRRLVSASGEPVFQRLEGGNSVLGAARLRMLKVAPNVECAIPSAFQSAYGSCFGYYSQEAEDIEDFGPIVDDGNKVFRYFPSDEGSGFHGEITTYPQSGFVQVLTKDERATNVQLEQMLQYDFLTEATRAIFYEFTVYNFNLGLYAVCRIAFEVAPSGLWQKTFNIEVLTQRHIAVLGFGTIVEWFLLVDEVLLAIFALRYLVEEISELVGSSRKLAYFKDPWNILDLTNLILIYTALGLRIRTWIAGSAVQIFVPTDGVTAIFPDYSEAAENVSVLRGMVAFNAVLTWFKTVKYYSVVPYIRVFMHTVSKSQRMLISFVIIFFAVHYGFVVAYSVAFGQSLLSLRTVWKANIFLLRTILGDGSFEEIVNGAPHIGPLLMTLLILGMIFILMNLFSAIMIRALADAKRSQDREMQRKWEQLCDRAALSWRAFKDAARLENKIRNNVPGLYSRVMRRLKKREDLEYARDMALLVRQQAKKPDDLLALGPGSPACGRRPKKALASVAVRDGDSDDDSEADLGPLFAQQQLRSKGARDAEDGGGRGGAGDPTLGLPALADVVGSQPRQEASSGTPDEEEEEVAVQLLLDATEHVAAGIVERTRGARGVLFSEMADSREVLLGVGAVLQVLGQRARDLQAQQDHLLSSS